MRNVRLFVFPLLQLDPERYPRTFYATISKVSTGRTTDVVQCKRFHKPTLLRNEFFLLAADRVSGHTSHIWHLPVRTRPCILSSIKREPGIAKRTESHHLFHFPTNKNKISTMKSFALFGLLVALSSGVAAAPCTR